MNNRIGNKKHLFSKTKKLKRRNQQPIKKSNKKSKKTLEQQELEQPDMEQHEQNRDKVKCLPTCTKSKTSYTTAVACDTCNEWYHIECINVSVFYAHNVKIYTCPLCQ